MTEIRRLGETNADSATVTGFGEEWSLYDQSVLGDREASQIFDAYFRVFPWERIAADATGFDLGCGSGRWARLVARRVGLLHCIDASAAALAVARRNLSALRNCEFHEASVDRIPLPDASQDFGYSLGVLHHVPDTARAVRDCVAKLKPGAPFLLYLYYAFDNRPWWYRLLWRISDVPRRFISRMPFRMRAVLTMAIAVFIYWPLARIARAAEKAGGTVDPLPLSGYRHRSFYTMRTDALDRFGTRLEQRFTRDEMQSMMWDAGLTNIRFSEEMPYWCAVGLKREEQQ